MTRTTQDDRTTQPAGGIAQRGVTVTTFAVLRRHLRTLASATLRVVGLYGLAGLLMTAVIFALAWPVFTHMRNERIRYHLLEDPYLHDHSSLGLVALYTLPLFLLLLATGSAALQCVCSRALASGTQGAPEEDRSGAPLRKRLRPVLAVYALRGLIVWPFPLFVSLLADSLTGYQIDTENEYLKRGSLPHTLIADSPMVAILIAVLLRLAFTLAPAAAADGLGPFAALGRSWSLMWKRAGGIRVLALALPLAALAAGLLLLTVQLALPLRPLVRSLLDQATGNFFAAYYAGILAPVIVGTLVTAILALPLTFTAFATLHERLHQLRDRSAGHPADSTA